MLEAAILFDNYVDDTDTATVTVAGALPLAGASRLLSSSPHVGATCRVNATSGAILIDLGSSRNVDTLMLAGVSGEDPDFRVRFSITDPTGVAGEVYDSTTIDGLPYFDPEFGRFVHLNAAPLSTRYVLFNQSEAGVPYTEWGRLALGARQAFGENYQAPWSDAAAPNSVYKKGVGGHTFVDKRQGFQQMNLNFGFASEADVTSIIKPIRDRQRNLGHLDMLLIRDPESTNLSEDSVWGFIVGTIQKTQDLYVIPPLFGVSINFEQRL